MVSKNEPEKLPTSIIFFHPPAAPTITLSDTTCTAMAQNLVELVDYCCTVKCFGFFRIPDRTQKMWTICAGSLHTRVVHEVLHDLEEKFKSACVPEPKESAQYILAHAIGHKTVSMSICATWHIILIELRFCILSNTKYFILETFFPSQCQCLLSSQCWKTKLNTTKVNMHP